MNEERRDDSHGIDDNDQTRGRESEATSKETVSDLEEGEAGTDSNSSEPDPGPSPDGALDESNENKDAGPM